MRKISVLGYMFLSVLFTSCLSSTIPVRRAEMSFEAPKPTKETIDAITYILNEKSYEIDSINDTYGFIYTKWKKTNYSNTGATLFAAAATGTAAKYSRYVKLDFKISENGYIVSPREKQVNVISKLAQQSTNEIEVELVPTSKEGQEIQKLVEEINGLLGITGSVTWNVFDNVVQ